MTKYTAKDFANARFAEHEDGGTARTFPQTATGARWLYGGVFVLSDEEMAERGWVPVPTKPQITETEYRLALDETRHPQYVYGFTDAMKKLGGEVVPDPEPTNAEQIEEIIGKIGGLPDWERQLLAEGLDKAGVKAPEGNA